MGTETEVSTPSGVEGFKCWSAGVLGEGEEVLTVLGEAGEDPEVFTPSGLSRVTSKEVEGLFRKVPPTHTRSVKKPTKPINRHSFFVDTCSPYRYYRNT